MATVLKRQVTPELIEKLMAVQDAREKERFNKIKEGIGQAWSDEKIKSMLNFVDHMKFKGKSDRQINRALVHKYGFGIKKKL